ncbi:MAG: transcriptional repressor [Pyrinomonadaceae bacterium]
MGIVQRLCLKDVETMAASQGFKMTPQRRMIIGFLEGATSHPTADEVYFAVNKKIPMTSRATVYNTLNWLKSVDMLRERFEGDKVRYDPNCERHHHFICRCCGLVEDIHFDSLQDLGLIDLPQDHSVESYEITLRGICKGCE